MRLRAAVAIALLVVLPSLVGGAAAAPAPPAQDGPTGTALSGGTAPVTSPGAAQQDDPLANETLDRPDPHTVINVHVRPDGDARFAIESRYVLADENDTAAFETFASRVVGGGVSTRYSDETFQRYADAAAAATGREMTVRNGSWTAETRNGTGVLVYSFVWTNFADTSGDRLRVGDAFAGPSGTWFPELLDGQRLVISSQAPYNSVLSAPRAPENGTITWTGPQRFETGDVYVVYTSAPRSTPTPTPTTAGPAAGVGNDESTLPMALIGLGVAVLLVAVGAGGYLLAQRRSLPDDEDGAGAAAGRVTETDGDGRSPVGTAAGSPGGTDAAESDAPDATEVGAATTATGAGDAATDPAAEADADADEAADEEEEIDPALLSDEERVERLLRDNGGRMKQGNIVSETGWSNAKVSQLLSAMDEDDRINKLRLGRENLIALPDEDIGEID